MRRCNQTEPQPERPVYVSPVREVASLIDMTVAIQFILKFTGGVHVAPRVIARRHRRGTDIGRPIRLVKVLFFDA
jgi:hypothetical protein